MEQLLSPQSGYDLVAPSYSTWYWQEFWKKNEAPIILQLLQPLNGRGLNAGSGTGLYRAAQSTVAFDLSGEMLRQDTAIIRVQGDVKRLPFRDAAFDWLLCTRVLTHIEDLHPPIDEFFRVLKPGAYCIISDVAADHGYAHTRIPHEEGKVHIQTYKHTFSTLQKAAKQKLRLDSFRTYRLHDLLWKPPREQFQKLYDDPNRPIFHISEWKRYAH